jgi:hypothetical protein
MRIAKRAATNNVLQSKLEPLMERLFFILRRPAENDF